MDIKLTGRGGPWRNAPLRDRILMLGALHENGMSRSRIREKLRVLPPLLNSALDQLVTDEWLRAEHPDDRPTRDSFYTLNREREGLRPLMDYWYIEYGLNPGEASWRPRREPDRGLSDEQVELLSEAVRSADQDAAPVPSRTYRSFRSEALDQYQRTSEIESRMQSIYSETKWSNERARDIVHLPPEHRTRLPGPRPAEGGRVADLLLLAAACRAASREDAWKFAYLARSADAAIHRVQAMSATLGRGRHALAPLLTPNNYLIEEALRAGITIASTSELLDERKQYAGIDDVGFAGDVLIAYTYRDMAAKLEDIASRIIALPAVAGAASSPPGLELLGDPAVLDVPASRWPNSHAQVLPDRDEPLPDDHFGEVFALDDPRQLRAGDRIVGVGTRVLSTSVDVHADPTESEDVELTIPDSHITYAVPLAFLGGYDKLQIRRPKESADER